MACALAAIGLTAAGCGSEDHPNEPRPAKPIEVTARVDNEVVEVSPSDFGAGLTVFTISNQSDEAVALTLDGPVAADAPQPLDREPHPHGAALAIRRRYRAASALMIG